MLLERPQEQAGKPPEYDWDAYYLWLFGKLGEGEKTEFSFWQCRKCLSVNAVSLPARFAKCRGCGLIHLP